MGNLNMKILVTGATGFIGKELIKSLQNSYDIAVLVRPSSEISLLETINCEIVKFHEHEDIIDIFTDNNFVGVVHIASNILVNHMSSDIGRLMNSNITFATYLLEASKLTNVKWFINTGTFWQNYQNEDYNPVNLYAATKEAFETIAKYYTETSDLIFTTIKLNDTFGPNDPRTKVFNLWNDISKTKAILDMSKGEQIIDISYIEDVINGYTVLIEHLNSSDALTFKNKTFVISNNEKLTLKELASLFEDITNTQLNINWGGREYRQREVMKPYSRGKNVLNWEQTYSLKDGIVKTLRDMKNDSERTIKTRDPR